MTADDDDDDDDDDDCCFGILFAALEVFLGIDFACG
jgi:hypothetical protein